MLIMAYTFAISAFIPIMVYTLSYMLFMRSLQDRHKSTPFECGFNPFSQARVPFSTRFFLLAIIFIVFDIEVVLLTPIPMLLYNYMYTGVLGPFLVFMLILFMGLLHEWKEGSIDWVS